MSIISTALKTAAFITFLLPTLTHAQSTWLIQEGTNTVTVEWIRPSIKPGNSLADDDGYGFLSSNLYLGAKYEVLKGFSVVAELPFAAYGYDFRGENYSSEEFGNPYIGIETMTADDRIIVEAGLRIPAFDEEALTSTRRNTLNLATMADMDRVGAFMGYVIPLKIVVNGYPLYDWNGLRVKCRGGIINLYTNETKKAPNMNYVLYNVMASYRFPEFEVQAGWGGLYLTDAWVDPHSRAYDSATLAVSVPVGQWHLGAVLRWPLTENVQDRMSNILHLGATYDLE